MTNTRSYIMKQLHLALALFAVLACSGLYGQTTILQAEIPFDFQIGGTQMLAGAYTIHYSVGLVTVYGDNGHHAVMALTTPSARPTASAAGLLQFKRYGDAYFFAGVWTPYSRDGGALPKSKREKELAERLGRPQMTEVALGSK
jgi:hypothetical protein